MIVIPPTLCRAVRLLEHLSTTRPTSSTKLGELAGGLTKDKIDIALKPLRDAGILQTAVGMRGGWKLARPLADIEFSDVAGALLGNQIQVCAGCEQIKSGCRVARIAKAGSAAALEHLGRYSIADVLGGRRRGKSGPAY